MLDGGDADEAPEIKFERVDNGLLVLRGGEVLARYVFGDERTTRPFLMVM